MNPIASALNETLRQTVAGRLLSDFGRRIYFPKGISAQTSEAARLAHRLNATIGMATEGGEPIILDSVAAHLPTIPSSESVAYAPTAGVAALRHHWREEIIAKNPDIASETAISLPIVTPGITSGISLCSDLFADRGDRVLIPDLYWGNYRLILEGRRQAEIVTFPLFDDRMRLNIEGLRDALRRHGAGGKLLLVLNFPNNPSGYAPTTEEQEAITEAVHDAADRGTDLLVIHDDAYSGLWYEPGLWHQSLFARFSSLHENILAVKADGATKEEYAWGLRVGFVTMGGAGLSGDHYAALENKMTGALRSSISNCSMLGQQLILRLLNSPTHREEKERRFRLLRSRYRRIRALLETRRSETLLSPMPFNAGYFLCLRCNGFSAERLRQSLLAEGVGTIAIGDDYLRVAYSTIDEGRLEELFDRIYEQAKHVR